MHGVDRLQKLWGLASRRQLDTLAVFIDGETAQAQVDRVRWTAEALSLGDYRFRKYKTRRKIRFPKEALIGVYPSVVDEPGCNNAVREAKAAAAGRGFDARSGQ